MVDFSWKAAFEAVSGGYHDLVGVERVRKACDALGIPQPKLHETEVAEISRLQEAAANNLARAEAIRVRPAPENRA